VGESIRSPCDPPPSLGLWGPAVRQSKPPRSPVIPGINEDGLLQEDLARKRNLEREQKLQRLARVRIEFQQVEKAKVEIEECRSRIRDEKDKKYQARRVKPLETKHLPPQVKEKKKAKDRDKYKGRHYV
jgi:hypothetical protein